MAGSCDFLSFCPSLLHVLQFCKHNDILNCKLTNRRIYDVVRQNPFSLPRRRLLRVFVKTWKEGTKEYVRIGIDYRLIMFVTEGQIILVRCQRTSGSPRSWHILNKVVPTTYVKSYKDVADGLLELVQTDFAYTDTESYENGTIEVGLHKLFSFLLQQCSICRLSLENTMKADWLNGISLAFCDIRSSCTEIAAVEIGPGIQGLLSSSGCEELGLASSSWKNGFLNNVVSMSSWTSRCRYNKTLNEFDSIETELLPLLKIWEAAKTVDEICLNGLQLTAPLRYLHGDISNKFNKRAVGMMLRKLKYSTEYETYYRDDDEKHIYMTFIGRLLGKRLLTLTLTEYSSSQRRNTLLVEEASCSSSFPLDMW